MGLESNLKREYAVHLLLYQRMDANITRIIERLLDEKGILFLSVTGRIKTFESLLEKIARKSYSDPFNENEDFCGVRIVVYYTSDVPLVQEIIDTEFDLQTTFDKESELNSNEFGYRSKHSIVKVKSSWGATPDYRGLENIKIEIQIRTILMHAWAEIQHKLAYKNETQIPRHLERKFSMLSASLEGLDDDFQELKNEIESYKDDVKLSVQADGKVSDAIQFNLASLSALTDSYLPGYPRNNHTLTIAYQQLVDEKLSLGEVEELLIKIMPYVQAINDEVFPKKNLRLTQGTILGYAMDIFRSLRSSTVYSTSRHQIIERYKALLA